MFPCFTLGMATDLPYRIDVWFDDHCNAVEELLATASTLAIARAAYNKAVQDRPERMITLRNGIPTVTRSRPSPPDANAKVVPIRRIGPVVMGTDDEMAR
jgi:hypothetical protein